MSRVCFNSVGLHGPRGAMERSLLLRPELSVADVYFAAASTAWRRNKVEVFGSAGSSGIFEYRPPSNCSTPQSGMGETPALHLVFSGAEVDSTKYGASNDSRLQYYRDSKSRQASKIPKELASIREQSLIPVYMDQLPPRKCRIISSSSTS